MFKVSQEEIDLDNLRKYTRGIFQKCYKHFYNKFGIDREGISFNPGYILINTSLFQGLNDCDIRDSNYFIFCHYILEIINFNSDGNPIEIRFFSENLLGLSEVKRPDLILYNFKFENGDKLINYHNNDMFILDNNVIIKEGYFIYYEYANKCKKTKQYFKYLNPNIELLFI